ncbi:putative rRNA methylase SpoU family [Synechococcus sp. PCC 7502]|uniref:tRNA (cytidine(34)-2'-O)-methyltransferase n=1 Tax=Synechococcus sp. PCC 7502 TaxID=1173263 RepID=UPI00029FCDA6|nr:tRNA (cytidine(34)-2'-O)-methyltransferase [Synechococcus sp. PCC 7502]AFY72602.1 putative rRNA methylase SpoU family [Synechococcus sp. PCC 7502]
MLQVALVYPQIPPNTGNIARTCAATKTRLHLVEPLGFEISDRALKRAGLDYWQYTDLQIHANLESLAAVAGRWVCFSARGKHDFRKFEFTEQDILLFGSETSGLPPEVLAQNLTVAIPMDHPKVRSLNLSVSVAIALFEARRQLNL